RRYAVRACRISASSRARCWSLRCSSSDCDIDLFDIRQRPLLLEEFLLWTVETEHQFEFAGRIGRYPVRFLPGRRLWAEIEIDRAVSILFHIGIVRCGAGAIDVLDERMRLPIVGGERPV